METLEMVQKEWLAVKEEYQNLINERVELLKDEKWTELTHQNQGLTKYFPKEIELYKKAERLREMLVNLDPQNHHCGKKNMSFKSNKKLPKFSLQGDHGFLTCCECHGLFDPVPLEKKRGSVSNERLTGDEAFKSCKHHHGVKSLGQMRLKKEDE